MGTRNILPSRPHFDSFSFGLEHDKRDGELSAMKATSCHLDDWY